VAGGEVGRWVVVEEFDVNGVVIQHCRFRENLSGVYLQKSCSG
jgi:nitrous oxidase accessory protein NosD